MLTPVILPLLSTLDTVKTPRVVFAPASIKNVFPTAYPVPGVTIVTPTAFTFNVAVPGVVLAPVIVTVGNPYAESPAAVTVN
jgi:hypothetical protein